MVSTQSGHLGSTSLQLLHVYPSSRRQSARARRATTPRQWDFMSLGQILKTVLSRTVKTENGIQHLSINTSIYILSFLSEGVLEQTSEEVAKAQTLTVHIDEQGKVTILKRHAEGNLIFYPKINTSHNSTQKSTPLITQPPKTSHFHLPTGEGSPTAATTTTTPIAVEGEGNLTHIFHNSLSSSIPPS